MTLPLPTAPQAGKPTILIAEDHPVVRIRLKGMVQDAFPGAVIGQAENARQALELTRSKPWDVVLLDISMPDRTGLDVLPEIKREQPDTRVLMVSSHPEDEYGAPSFEAGASGYVAKGKVPEKLVDAIHRVLSGGSYFSYAHG